MAKAFTRFHLEPPPGFKGLDPQKTVTFYQRFLPHWRQEGATYFVTFRLADSLPKEKLNQLRAMRDDAKRKLETVPEDGKRVLIEQRSQRMTALTEKWLDQGLGSCLLRRRDLRKEIIEALKYFNDDRYELGSYVVMPNHIHLIIRPFHGKYRSSLEEILQDRKRASSYAIGKLSGERGSIWQTESYDRIVRDPQHLWRCLQYIGNNPKKANLCEEDYALYIDPRWKDFGWDFE